MSDLNLNLNIVKLPYSHENLVKVVTSAQSEGLKMMAKKLPEFTEEEAIEHIKNAIEKDPDGPATHHLANLVAVAIENLIEWEN